MRLATTASLALICLALPATSRAASSYDNCTGFIESLPAVINTQGVWCMNKDLATVANSGPAITIAGNNITLDCNNFKLGGLGAGLATAATGVQAADKNNVTLRNCNIRGFRVGANIYGDLTGGHLVEDNRFDANTQVGVYVQGNGSVLRRNLVLSTGGSTNPGGEFAVGIYTGGSLDVLDNHISEVDAPPSESAGTAYGVYVFGGTDATVMRNTIRSVIGSADSVGVGIDVSNSFFAMVEDNTIYAGGSMFSTGILCSEFNSGHVRDNKVLTGDTQWSGCIDMGGNGPVF